MTLIDLSHIIDPDISVFPGTEKPVFERKEIEGYPEVKITVYPNIGGSFSGRETVNLRKI